MEEKLLSLIDELRNRLDIEPDSQDVWELVNYMNCDGTLRFYKDDMAIDIDIVKGEVRNSSKNIVLTKFFRLNVPHPAYVIGLEDNVKEFAIRHNIPQIFVDMDDFVNRLTQAINVMEKASVVSEPY